MEKEQSVTITVPNVSISLLREQRDWLLTLPDNADSDEADGLINLLDAMLDIAEGYDDITNR